MTLSQKRENTFNCKRRKTGFLKKKKIEKRELQFITSSLTKNIYVFR
jgi:hypothetical protein